VIGASSEKGGKRTFTRIPTANVTCASDQQGAKETPYFQMQMRKIGGNAGLPRRDNGSCDHDSPRRVGGRGAEPGFKQKPLRTRLMAMKELKRAHHYRRLILLT